MQNIKSNPTKRIANRILRIGAVTVISMCISNGISFNAKANTLGIEHKETISNIIEHINSYKNYISNNKALKAIRENKLYYIDDDGYKYYLDERYQDYLYEVCKEYGVEDYYKAFIALMYHESQFNPKAVSSTEDYGLMQINKMNHEWLCEKLSISNVEEEYSNIKCGVYMLSQYIKKYGDLQIALVCYNMGESAVKRGTYSTLYSRCVLEDISKLKEMK